MRTRVPLLVVTLVVSLVTASTALVALPAPPASADPATTRLRLVAEPGPADATAPLRARLTDEAGGPVAGAVVVLERRVDGEWVEVGAPVTGDDGRVATAVERSRDPGDNAFRARFAGDATSAPSGSGLVRSGLVRRAGVVRLAGPRRVRDGRPVDLRLRWTTRQGDGVPGRVRVYRRDAGRWEQVRSVRADESGRATATLTPRVDAAYRASARPLPWVTGDRSGVHRVDNLPPGEPVRLPGAAPRPRVGVPPQARASTRGPDPVVSTVPQRIWSSMTGRTWHQGCPVGRSGLRLLRISYWGYDGYRYRGELVAATSAVDNMARALAAMYRERLPLRSLYRVDRFGWSPRLHGGDDHASMAAGNTSAFNCRDVVGRPGVPSPHSWGRSLDLNTWENPYHSADGWTPNAWWPGRSHPRVAWRSREHRVVEILLAQGFRWTYGTEDGQHFDVPAASGRVVAPPGCVEVVCD